MKIAVVRLIFILHAHIFDIKWDVTCESHCILLFTTYYHHCHDHYSHRSLSPPPPSSGCSSLWTIPFTDSASHSTTCKCTMLTCKYPDGQWFQPSPLPVDFSKISSHLDAKLVSWCAGSAYVISE